MPAVLPILLGLTLALPASSQPTRVELEASAQFDGRTMDTSFAQPNPPTGRWLGGNGRFGISIFHHRVIDDETAPTLQPFLQRVARFRLEGGGGGASIRYPLFVAPPSNLLYDAKLGGGRVDTSAEGYIGHWFYLAGRFGVDYERWQRANESLIVGGFSPTTQISPAAAARLDSDEVLVSTEVATGVRWRDLLVSAGWGVTAYRIGNDAMRVGFWGGAFVGVRAVVRRFVDLALRIQVRDQGADVDGEATFWLRRRFGLEAGVAGGHGAFVDSSVVYDRAGGRIGLEWWLTPRVAASLSYAPTWQRGTPVAGLGTAVSDFSFVAHLVTLTVKGRPPTLR